MAVCARCVDVVWRLGPDRVIACHVSSGADDAGADLTGTAALVWVALDEPGTVDELGGRLRDANLATTNAQVAEAVNELLAAGWLRLVETGRTVESGGTVA